MKRRDDKLQAVLDRLERDPALWSDFLALCDCGGRRAGTPSETRALELAQRLLGGIAASVRGERDGKLSSGASFPPAFSVQKVDYAGWRLKEASLTLADGSALACNPLLGSQSTAAAGVSAEVCDLGRGAQVDFERCASEIPGRFVLVRHEYPFSAQHVHRRRKLAWAMERGAAGFIIANPHEGSGPVTGSSGRAGQAGIPAVGTDLASALRLSHAGSSPVHLKVSAEDYAGQTSVLILDLPGRSGEWVVLSAHIDGHDLAESAMDNGTGVAAALAIARACAPHVADCQRGLRVCLFSAEEWALAGSKQYLEHSSADDLRAVALNVNLDTVAGDDRLTALTSEFAGLDAFVRNFARDEGIELGTYLPVMSNSDHYNFAQHGIPALRLVAGFDRPGSNIRYILTRGDTREKVERANLAAAARIAALLVWRGLTMSGEEAAAIRQPPRPVNDTVGNQGFPPSGRRR